MINLSHYNHQCLVTLLPKTGKVITVHWEQHYQRLVILTPINVNPTAKFFEGKDTLFVPMKLTVLNVDDDMSEEQVEQYNDITKTISQCANSQNAVTGADFFSNHPFHVLMEKLSHKVMAPPVNGKPYQTIWYYERSKNKWEVYH